MGKEIKKDILASRLLDVMEKRNVSQRELANHIGVNYQGLNRRINQSRLTPVELNMICADLDCDVDYILGTTDENAGFMRISKFSSGKEFDNAWMSLQKKFKENPDGVRLEIAADNDEKKYYISCDRQPLEKVIKIVIESGGLKELLQLIDKLSNTD